METRAGTESNTSLSISVTTLPSIEAPTQTTQHKNWSVEVVLLVSLVVVVVGCGGAGGGGFPTFLFASVSVSPHGCFPSMCCFFLPLPVCRSVCLSISVCLCRSVFLAVSVCLSLFIPVLFLNARVCVSLCFSFCLSLSVALCLCVYVSDSVSLLSLSVRLSF